MGRDDHMTDHEKIVVNAALADIVQVAEFRHPEQVNGALNHPTELWEIIDVHADPDHETRYVLGRRGYHDRRSHPGADGS